MKKFYIIIVLVVLNLGLLAQNTLITDDAGYTVNSSAMLDVKSVNKGLLVPRLTTFQMNEIASPATGLLVFNTDKNCFCYRAESEWVVLSSQLLPQNAGVSEALFHVINASGDTVFAVYPEGVRINVGDGLTKGSGNKGGFAVGGFSGGKSYHDFLQVYHDSVRVYVNENVKGSGNKGGFAVGGFSGGKLSPSHYMQLDPKNYFIGHQSGKAVTTGLYNSFIGYQAGIADTSGSYNTLLGYKAGYSIKNGGNNVFIGFETGFTNDSAHNNVFLGNQAGYFAQSSNNVFLGFQAGYYNRYGQNNVFLGYKAGANISDAWNNVYIGYLAGTNNIDGHDNVFIGSECGKQNFGGYNNVFMGKSAGISNTGGSGNIFVGQSAGRTNQSGDLNLIMGNLSGYSNFSGSNNIFFGSSSGFSNYDGLHNIAIGTESGNRNISGSKNVFIGYKAGYWEYGSDRLYIANSDGNESEVLIYGEFDNKLLKINGTCHINDILKLTPRTSDPVSGSEGMIYLYKNGSNFKLRVHNGTTWVDL